MTRVAVVAGPDPGHALPALGVAAALHARGHEVRLVTGAGHERTAAALGVPMEPLPLLAPSADDHDLGHRLWARAAEMARPLARRLADHVPDVVVVDNLARAGAFAAQLLERPWVELIGHHLDDPAPDLPPVGTGRRPARTPWRRADDRRIHRLQLLSREQGDRQAAQAAASLGLPATAPPALRLVASVPGLERLRHDWPPTAHVVGSLAVDPIAPVLQPPPGVEPLVVVTDPTVPGVDGGLGRLALAALQHLDVRVVVTSSWLEPRCGDRVVVGRGPHRPLLDAATVAVSNGGGGFVSKAVAAAVPMVVLPLQGDQREAAARLRESGAGRIVRPGRAASLSLRWAVIRQLTDPDAAAAARSLAGQAAALGPDLAARLVERVIEGDRPVASGPHHHLGRPAG